MTENELQTAIRLSLGKRGDCVLFRNQAGVAEIHGRTMRFGLVRGASDLIGLVDGGRFVAIEIKTPKGRATPEQIAFIDLINRKGGAAGIARSVEEANKIIDHAKNT